MCCLLIIMLFNFVNQKAAKEGLATKLVCEVTVHIDRFVRLFRFFMSQQCDFLLHMLWLILLIRNETTWVCKSP